MHRHAQNLQHAWYHMVLIRTGYIISAPMENDINAKHYLMQALQHDAPLVHAFHKSLEDLPIFVCIAAVSQLG